MLLWGRRFFLLYYTILCCTAVRDHGIRITNTSARFGARAEKRFASQTWCDFPFFLCSSLWFFFFSLIPSCFCGVYFSFSLDLRFSDWLHWLGQLLTSSETKYRGGIFWRSVYTFFQQICYRYWIMGLQKLRVLKYIPVLPKAVCIPIITWRKGLRKRLKQE